MNQPVFIVVANSAVARLLERSSDAGGWVERECLVHPGSRLHDNEARGHSIGGRSGLAPRIDPSEYERVLFSREIASKLQEYVNANQLASFTLFASNPFLGELLAHLPDGVKRLVSSHHATDLTSLSSAELGDRLAREFHLDSR
ncbi:MAG: host attachment protein [Burkholderiales bacterium]|nr:host attachment protein [Burkholderiales bacterium]